MTQNEIDWSKEAPNLVKGSEADAAFYRMVADALLEPTDHLVVDFGCGGGGMAAAFHERAMSMAWQTVVVGLDGHESVVVRARDSRSDIRFAVASFEDSPERIREVAGGAPDLVWARGAVHHAADERSALKTLVETVSAGGRLALQEGGLLSSFMPNHVGVGDPGLQLRLQAARHESARHRLSAGSPIPVGWTTAMRQSGLVDVMTKNLLLDLPAPLADADLEHLLRRLRKQVEWAEDKLSESDRAAWRRLLDPEDDTWLGYRDDLFRLEVHSVHIGRKPT